MVDPQKDYYCVLFTFSGCRFEISINDIPVLRYSEGGSVSTRMFINQFVDSGINSLRIVMLPQDDSGFRLTTMGKIKVLHIKGEVEQELAELSFLYDNKNPTPSVSLDKEFAITQLPFTPSPWNTAVPKILTNDERDKLNRKFLRLMALFRNKDIEQIMDEGYAKDNLYIERYYYDSEERRSYIREFFNNKFNDPDWQSSTYFESHYQLREYAGSRLYSFELSNLKSPLEVNNAVQKVRLNVPVFFVYNEGEFEWVL